MTEMVWVPSFAKGETVRVKEGPMAPTAAREGTVVGHGGVGRVVVRFECAHMDFTRFTEEKTYEESDLEKV